MPLKPRPTDPDKVVFVSRKYDLPKREWVGLTDEEIQECLQGLPTQTIDVYARRIEAILEEKNNG